MLRVLMLSCVRFVYHIQNLIEQTVRDIQGSDVVLCQLQHEASVFFFEHQLLVCLIGNYYLKGVFLQRAFSCRRPRGHPGGFFSAVGIKQD